MIKAVIFDMDGLMFDTETMFKKLFREKLTEANMFPEDEIIESMIGCDSRLIVRYEEQFPGITDVMKLVKKVRIDYFFETFPVPGSANKKGLQELIQYLDQKKIPYAIASSSAKEDILKFLDHAGFDIQPNEIVSSRDGMASKPAPDVFLATQERLGVKPEECVVLEDSKNGIIAASRAGMHSIFIPDQILPDEEMKEYIQTTLEDLSLVIGYLENQ